MSAKISKEIVSVTRTTRTIPRPFDEVVAKLKSSINREGAGKGLGILKHIDSQSTFESAVHSSLGPHDFMQFAEIDHGPWLKLYQPEGGRLLRIIFGNPLIAVTMLRHDRAAGLFVPVEALIIERDDGNTDILQIQPATEIASHASASVQLKQAAADLDAKLEILWEFVAA